MSEQACIFCIDAGMDFDWCRVCGRGDQIQEMFDNHPSRRFSSAEGRVSQITREEINEGVRQINDAIQRKTDELKLPVNQTCVRCKPYPGDPCVCGWDG